MRRVNLGIAPPGLFGTAEGKFLFNALRDIELASFENDPTNVASAYTVENYTTTRTLDAGTATATDIANVLATLIADLQRGKVKG